MERRESTVEIWGFFRFFGYLRKSRKPRWPVESRSGCNSTGHIYIYLHGFFLHNICICISGFFDLLGFSFWVVFGIWYLKHIQCSVEICCVLYHTHTHTHTQREIEKGLGEVGGVKGKKKFLSSCLRSVPFIFLTQVSACGSFHPFRGLSLPPFPSLCLPSRSTNPLPIK